MLCFNKSKGYLQGIRFAAKPLVGIRQMALARELDQELDHVELFQGWKGHLKNFFPFPSKEVKDGSVEVSRRKFDTFK